MVLREIVTSLQSFLYLDVDQRGTPDWNPDKPISDADLGEHLIGLLGKHDLVPDRKLSTDGARFVLYDFDTEQLVTNHLYASYAEAVDDAAGLHDVIILPLALSPEDISRP